MIETLELARPPMTQAARITEVNGWTVVADYGDVEAEVQAVREGAGVMDRSAWARLQLTGRDRLDFLQRMSTHDLATLRPGAGKPTVFPDARGRIIDRTLVYGWEDEALLVGSPGANRRLAAWLRQYIFFRDQVAVADLTNGTGMLTVYGPQALAVVREALGEVDTAALGEDGFLESYGFAPIAAAEVLVAATDPLGGQGLNLIVEPDKLPGLWERLVETGAVPVGYSAYDRLRIEAGWPEIGREMTDAYNPLEAGLLTSVSFTKGCYIGQEVIARLDTYQKLKQHLMGLRFAASHVEVEPGAALEMGGRTVGTLTSLAASPDGAIGLGYVRASCALAGATVNVTTADGCVAVKLVNLPGRWQRPFGVEIED